MTGIRWAAISIAVCMVLASLTFRYYERSQSTNKDFRDPAVLSRAIATAAQNAGDGIWDASACAQTIFPRYVCSVRFDGGYTATYDISVSIDGTSWHTY